MSAFPAGRSVLIVGDYYLDLVFAGLPRWPQPGTEVFGTGTASLPGGAFTPQRALHRLGVPAVWAARLGDDPHSRLVLDEAHAEGIDTSAYLLHPGPVRNISVAMSYGGERGFVSFKEPLPPLDVIGVILDRRPACVLLTELTVGPRLVALVEAAHRVGAVVFMDCQHTDATLDDPAITAALKAVDIFAPNAGEARVLTGHGELNDALDRLRELTPTVVIKNGAHGALAATSTERVSTAAEAVTVIDTIGAGDCFDAGFVAGHVFGLGLAGSTALGTLCGTFSVTGHGGAAAPSLAQIAERAPELVPWAA
ncbi:carbohydrate kinase family protein [Nonomuraea antimicrobica]|uniref:carbohydrate kinase family protein n=1 Tax=Nonomuraea antimicrobica TaxID=561173 RepID=UPI0031ED74AD